MTGEEIKFPTPLLERPVLVPLRALPTPPAKTAAAIQTAARADNHEAIAPTHAMLKGDKIIGYLSVNGMPNVHAWFDTKNPHVMDSLKMIEMGELVLRENGITAYSLLCAEESPFAPHLERLGFVKLGTTVLYIKQL